MQSQEKGFEIDQVRKELEANDVPEEEIRIIVRKVDEQVQIQAVNKSSRIKGMQLIIAGAILVVVGMIIFLITTLGNIDLGDAALFLCGQVVGGGSLIATGLAWRKQEAEKRRRLQFRPRMPRIDVFDDLE